MRCRTAIMSIPLLIIMEPIILKNRRSLKKTIISIIVIAILLFLVFPHFAQYLFTSFLFDDTDTLEMNSMNVRKSMLDLFYDKIGDNLFLGTGYLFIENFYAINLLNLGIIGSIPLFTFLLWSYRICFQNPNLPILFLTKMLFILYFFNGLLEAESPFGPGTRCFLLWFLLGYSLGFSRKLKNYMSTKKN